MLSFGKLCIGLGLHFVVSYQYVLSSDEGLTLVSDASPKRTFFELSTTIEGTDEREEDTVDSIIIRIGCSTNIDRAFKKYQKLSNPDRFIKRIVSEIYQENVQSVAKIVQFIDKLSDVETKYFALWTLHEEMLLANNFEFADNVFLSLEIVKNSSKFESFSEFDKRNVNVLLSSLNNMEGKTNAQIKELKELENMLITLLVDVNKNSKALTQLALKIYRMKKEVLSKNTDVFERLKNQIPKFIMFLLLSKESFCVRQAETNYYMFADTSDHYIGNNGVNAKIFFKNDGQIPSIGYKWQFELNETDYTFNIKNLYLEEYLLATSDRINYNDNSHKIIDLSRTKTESMLEKWTVIFLNQGTQIKIISSYNNQYLVSTGDYAFSNFHPIFTSIYDSKNVFTLEKC